MQEVRSSSLRATTRSATAGPRHSLGLARAPRPRRWTHKAMCSPRLLLVGWIRDCRDSFRLTDGGCENRKLGEGCEVVAVVGVDAHHAVPEHGGDEVYVMNLATDYGT